jgi:hypothetical protein
MESSASILRSGLAHRGTWAAPWRAKDGRPPE